MSNITEKEKEKVETNVGTVSKAALGKRMKIRFQTMSIDGLRRRTTLIYSSLDLGAYYGFPEHMDTIFN